MTCVSLLLLGLGLTPAYGASIALVPSASTVQLGDTFTVDILLNAGDAPGAHPGSFCAEIIMDADPAHLLLVDFTLTNPAINATDLVVGSADGRTTYAMSFDHAPDIGVIGTLTFQTLGNGFTSMGIADQDPFFSSFANHDPTNQPFIPEFIGANVEVVPLPAAGWLLIGGLGLLGVRARRDATS